MTQLFVLILAAQTFPSISELFPVADGLTWLYSKQSNLSTEPSSYGVSVSGKTEANGIVTWELSTSDSKRGSKTLYRVDSTGVFITATGAPPEVLTQPIPVLIGPLKAGKKWSYKGPVGGQSGSEPGEFTSNVQGMENLLVMGNQVNCVKIETKTTLGKGKQAIKVTRVSWYAPGIGLVREATNYQHEKSSISETVSLTKFSKVQ